MQFNFTFLLLFWVSTFCTAWDQLTSSQPISMLKWLYCLLFYIFLLLLVAPEISKHPRDTRAVEGQDVVFCCLVEGNPKPRVRWTKNEEEFNVTANPRLSSAIINETHTLAITDVHLTDAGQYRCLANNSVAQTTSSAATLIVEEYCKYLTQFT